MDIRDAQLSDFVEITAIYNHIILSSNAIYSDATSTVEERVEWWSARTAIGFPVLVAEDEGKIAGYASFSDFRPWPGYRFTVEGTIHIAEGARSRGLGSQLLNTMLDRAKALGKHVMVAGVDSENIASLRFLERSGFQQVGQLPEVGCKDGQFLTLNFLQYWITPPQTVAKEAVSVANL
jgi:L-amino acid N-acyltransferase YncA